MKNIILLLFLFLISCKEENTHIRGKIDLLSPPVNAITNLSELATDIEYLPLQTTNSSIVGYLRGIKIQDDRIFVASTEEIFCFDNKGQFLFKLSMKGRGPGEYQYINDFDINNSGDMLILISYSEMMVYRIEEDGFVFIKSLNIKPGGVDYPSEVLDIAFIPGRNDILISYQTIGEEPLRNIIINLEGDTLNTRPNYYKFKNRNNLGISSPHANIKYEYDNSLFFKGWQSDTIFTIDEYNNIIPYFILDSEGNLPTPDDFYDFVNQDLSIIFKSVPFENNLVVNNILETDRYLLLSYSYLNTSEMAIYDKIGDTKFEIDPSIFLVDDISYGVNFQPKISIDGKIYSWIDAFNFNKYFSESSNKETTARELGKRKSTEEWINSIKDSDNPILIIVTPKE